MTDRHEIDEAPSEFLKPHDAAELLMVSIRTLDRYQADGYIAPRFTPGGQRRFRRADIERLLVDQSKHAS